LPLLKASEGKPSVWFATRGNRSNPPLVMLHGFTGTHRTWDAVAPTLSKSHFLILPDLPGHGKSGTGPRDTMGVGPTSDAIAQVIELAEGGASRRKVALVGYSLGGRIALDLAFKQQELLSCLILEGASPGIELEEERAERRARDRALSDEIERRGIEWFVNYWEETPLFSSQRDLRPQVIQEIRRDRLSNSARGLAMSLRAAGAGETTSLWKQLETLGMPVLFVVGKKDAKYARIAEAMRKRVRGSSLVKVEGAGHCVHIERPDSFADAAERFLKVWPQVLRAAK
jgi:2-succinyl-6-hydroxy-2,4-cyclohexadiene-1-carboxylate synthase